MEQREEITRALAATREELRRLSADIVADQAETEELTCQEMVLRERLPEVERQMADLAPRGGWRVCACASTATYAPCIFSWPTSA